MLALAEILGWISVGSLYTWIYQLLASTEPFSFYLPGGLGKYYRIHKKITTKFTDVIGCDNLKKEVQSNLDGSKGKGYIFAGPPGLGKTLMARAIAGETKLPFIEIFANETQGSNIPTVFNKVAKIHRPCIILMDEGIRFIQPSATIFFEKSMGLILLI